MNSTNSKSAILTYTVFCDIDGTLVKHKTPGVTSAENHNMELLDGTIEKLEEWSAKGYTIILTTGRRESQRELTVRQLQKVGIFYDQLVMGIGRGIRILINDRKPTGEDSAKAIVVDRDCGIGSITI